MQFIFSSLHQILNDDEENYFYVGCARESSSGARSSRSSSAPSTPITSATCCSTRRPTAASTCRSTARRPRRSRAARRRAISSTDRRRRHAGRVLADRHGRARRHPVRQPRSGPGRVLLSAAELLGRRRRPMPATSWGTSSGDKWRGNVGVRFVRTEQTSHGDQSSHGRRDRRIRSATTTPITVDRSYDDVLPQLNFALRPRRTSSCCASPPRA